MSIFSIYVISEDGRCIYNQDLIPNHPPTQLVTGLLTAVQDFVMEVTGDHMQNLTAGGYTFVFEKFGPITIAVSTSSNIGEKITTMFNIRKIGLRFMKKYGEMLDRWQGDLSVFYSFEEDIRELLGEKNVIMKEAYPSKVLTPITLMSINKELQLTGRSLLQMGKGSPEDVAQVTGKTLYETTRDLESLVNLGHIGRFVHDEVIIYFVQE